jgi:hypothetical protein
MIRVVIALVLVLLSLPAGAATACPWVSRCCRPGPAAFTPCGPPVYYYYSPGPTPLIRMTDISPPAPAPDPRPTVKAVSEDVAPDGWCHIRGRIVFDGDKIPERNEIPKSNGAYTEAWVVNPTNRGVKNVVVWLTPELTKEQLEALKSRKLREVPFNPQQVFPGLSQKGERAIGRGGDVRAFSPHVVGAQAGSNLALGNNSQEPDNVKFMSVKNDHRRLTPTYGTACKCLGSRTALCPRRLE